MVCKEYERYFFQESEWELLLAGLGIDTWYGLDGGGPLEKTDGRACHLVLAGLYQKNMIDWDGKGVRIKNPFSPIFASLKDSGRCITVDRKNGEFPIQCCYVGSEGVVVTEMSQREKNALCVSYLCKEGFVRLILEYLSKYSEGIAAGSDLEGCADGKEIFLLELKDCRNGERMAKLTLYENGLQTCLEVENNKGTERIPYGRNRLKEYLKDWLEGEGE